MYVGEMDPVTNGFWKLLCLGSSTKVRGIVNSFEWQISLLYKLEKCGRYTEFLISGLMVCYLLQKYVIIR